MAINDPEDMSFVMQRIYDRHKDNEGDEIRDISRAILHVYKKLYELQETSDSLDSRIDDLESQR